MKIILHILLYLLTFSLTLERWDGLLIKFVQECPQAMRWGKV